MRRFFILMMGFIPYWKVQLPLDILCSNYEFYSYSAGLIASQGNVSGGEINESMKRSQKGWSYDFNSYAPSVVLKCGNTSIKCIGESRLVVNFVDSKSSAFQLSKIDPEACEGITRVIQRENKPHT